MKILNSFFYLFPSVCLSIHVEGLELWSNFLRMASHVLPSELAPLMALAGAGCCSLLTLGFVMGRKGEGGFVGLQNILVASKLSL